MKEKWKDWSEVTITNRFMFYKIFSTYPDACKKLLEILLGFKISKINYPLGEKDFEADIDSHSIRVDVYTEDEKNVYDIEMQAEYEDDLPERSRYYQALMDIDKLKAGEPYKNLKNSIVIFICMFDPFDKRKPFYYFKNVDIVDFETELGDRTEKIFFNVNEYDKIKEDGSLKSLLKYFSSGKIESGFTNSLERFVKIARHNAQWRQSYMTRERFEYYAKKHQKEEDEKEMAEMNAKMIKLNSQKNAEIELLKRKVAELEAKLNKCSPKK